MPTPKIISLFTGAGGMDYGFEAAGFKTAVAVEMDANAAKTLRKNRSKWPLIEKDIHTVSSSEILKAARLKKGDAAALIGGPPCQPFSKAGFWSNGDAKRLKDPRAKTLDAFMRVVADTLPEVFVLENVHGINYSGKEEGLHLLEDLVENINSQHATSYAPTWAVLKGADYGVPQTRTRFFMVGHRDGKPFAFPQPTHQDISPDEAKPRSKVKPYLTAWDALHDVRPSNGEDLKVRGKWGDLLASIPEGENYLWHTDRKDGLNIFGWRTRYWSFLLKLAKDRPSWTLPAQPGPAMGPFHWESRRLSSREMARLQTFPDDIIIEGGRQAVQRQLGNAVPSLLAEVIAREIQTQLLGRRPYRGQPRLSLRAARPIPEPEPAVSVPEKYLSCVGHHPAHPGEGKGPAHQSSEDE